MLGTLTVVGTIAMFMVGGGILTHGVHAIGSYFEQAAHWVEQFALVGPVLAWITPSLLNALFGVLVGAAALVVMSLFSRIRR